MVTMNNAMVINIMVIIILNNILFSLDINTYIRYMTESHQYVCMHFQNQDREQKF